MGEFFTEEGWLPLVEAQEKALVFDDFGKADAIEIGLRILRLAREKHTKPVVISIELDNTEVFSCMMPGTRTENRDWIRRKANTAKRAGISTLNLCLQAAYLKKNPSWLEREDAYVACGGAWPVRTKGEEAFAYIMVSGLEHYLDHQIIVDALSDYYSIRVETIKSTLADA